MADNYRTAEQILEKYSSGMGAELGREFHYCRQQFLEVTYLWDIYLTLFKNKQRADLLLGLGALAVQIKNQFLNGVALGVAKLLDPPATGKFMNMTLGRVCDACPEKVRMEASQLLLHAQNKAEKLREIRNKLIAHNDYQYATKQEPDLPYGTIKEITELLGILLHFLNLVDQHFLGQSTALLPLGNADASKLLISQYYYMSMRVKMRDADLGKPISFDDLKKLPDFLLNTKNDDERYNV